MLFLKLESTLLYLHRCKQNYVTMLNYKRLIERLQLLIQENELTASSFADKIGVQRSSISHILSGRNKPSLDFLAKIEHNFDQVSFHWLLTGEDLPTHSPSRLYHKIDETSIMQPTASASVVSSPATLQNTTKKVIDLIYVYSDGSFERFHSNS